MEFAKREPLANGQAALALMAGLIKILKDAESLEHAEIAGIFEEALRLLPDGRNRTDEDARDIIKALLKDVTAE
jgi:hypothetical protein